MIGISSISSHPSHPSHPSYPSVPSRRSTRYGRNGRNGRYGRYGRNVEEEATAKPSCGAPISAEWRCLPCRSNLPTGATRVNRACPAQLELIQARRARGGLSALRGGRG
jgi:hypothetical protein